MKLIKLGAAFLNMDMVTDVWVDEGQVSVFFAVPTMYSVVPFHGESNAITTREIRFSGLEAAALIRWLEKRAKDITPDHDEPADTNEPEVAGELVVAEYGAIDDGPGV